MTENEKTLVKMYIVNQGLRCDMDVSEARACYLNQPTPWNCFRYMLSLERKKAFDRFCFHLCELLHI